MHHIFLLYKFSLEPKEPVTPLTLYCKPLDPPAWFIRSKTLACTEHESRGLLCSRAAAAHAQEVTACHRRGWKAVRTKEHALGKGLTLPAKPLGTFFAQLTMKKNLSSKRRDFEQELIWSPNGIKFLPVLCTGETSTYSSQPCQVELFATASTNYQLTKVFSLCIFLPYFSLTSIYTGETIRAFISWFADGKAAAQRRLVNTGHRYSHWGHRGTVLSVNRNAVASLPWAFIPCQQDPGFIKGLKSKNRNIRVWSCPTPIQALNWGFQVGNPTANSVESSERHLWKLFGSRWAELLSGSVSLFLLWATLLPDQLLQVSASDKAGKSHGRMLMGGPIPQLHVLSHMNSQERCSLQVTHAQPVPSAAPRDLGSWATHLISALQLPYHNTQTTIFSFLPSVPQLPRLQLRGGAAVACSVWWDTVLSRAPAHQCPNHVMTWWTAAADSGDFFLCRAPRYQSATIGFI